MNNLILKTGTPLKDICSRFGGIIRDGKIVFDSERKAFECGKEVVLEGVRHKEPYEINVSWLKDTIYDISEGDKFHVAVSQTNSPAGHSEMHGHFCESILSTQDYIALMCNPVKESYAICPSGNYSKFTKMANEDFNTNVSTESKVIKMYRKGMKHERLDSIVGVIKIISGSIKLIVDKSIRKKEVSPTALCELRDKASKNSLIRDKKFWTKHSGKKSGVIFETNIETK